MSSTPLNPDNVFYSTFELSQAKLLSEIYDVALLSVAVRFPFWTQARQRLICFLRKPGVSSLGELLDLRRELANRQRARRHKIDDLSVFEGIVSFKEGRFESDVGEWVRGAARAFKRYCGAYGKPDLIHAHGRFLYAGAFALAMKEKAGIPYVYTDHSTFYARGLAPPEARSILAKIIDGASIFAPVSHALANSVRTFLGGELRSQEVAGNALDPIYERTPAAPPKVNDEFVFLNVSALEEQKGIDVLLRAFAKAFKGSYKYRLQICGDGSVRRGLESLVLELEIDAQVRFDGWVSPNEVLGYIDGAHVLVVSSRVETFGVVLIEALARGRPVIATRCGGPAEIVDHDSGLLVPPDDVDALAAALSAMARDHSKYDYNALRAAALATYGKQAFLERMRRIYRAALA